MVVGILHAYHAIPLYLQKLVLISPTSDDGCLVGIVHWQTKAMEFFFSAQVYDWDQIFNFIAFSFNQDGHVTKEKQVADI
jgi:hypothetical protein